MVTNQRPEPHMVAGFHGGENFGGGVQLSKSPFAATKSIGELFLHASGCGLMSEAVHQQHRRVEPTRGERVTAPISDHQRVGKEVGPVDVVVCGGPSISLESTSSPVRFLIHIVIM